MRERLISKTKQYLLTIVMMTLLVSGMIPGITKVMHVYAETTTSTITVDGTDYTLYTGFTATGGSSVDSIYTYDKMVDGDMGQLSSFHVMSQDGAYVEFNSDEPIIPKGYIVNLYNFNSFTPKRWVLKAKVNAGDEWTELSSYSGQDMVSEQQYACNNEENNAYKYFRFEASNSNNNIYNNIWLTEIRLYSTLPYTHLTVKAATCMATGIKRDCYRRNSDGKYFTDETGTTELAESDVIESMVPHSGDHHVATDTNIEYWQCSMCGKYFSDEGYTTEITEEDTKIYRTITIDGSISSLVTSNVSQALAGTTMYLYVSDLIDASTLKVNDGAVELTAETGTSYTFTMPAADVTVTASILSTYSITLPANMAIVSATNAADSNGKYISGTVIKFEASFGYTATNVSDGTNTLEPDVNGIYTVTVAEADINITATTESKNTLYLATANSDFTAADGNILIGSTSHTVTIAGNANITLNNATINGGIVCEGSATITLVGTNSVSGADKKAGIQIGGSGTTLTIKGNGSLTASGGGDSAGIGLSRAWYVDATGGDIVIEGGNITATGDNHGAGIGTGLSYGNPSNQTATIGNITIKGGSVRAIDGTNKSYPGNGIGKGGAYGYGHAVVGTITIYDGVEMVDASSISESVTYMHVDGNTETDVTANANTYFSIIEDGDRRVITPKDDTDYTITVADGVEHGTLTGAATAKYMEKVTITATPDLGYRLSRLVVKDADNNNVATTGNSFFMPKSNVTVSAVFEQGVHGTTEFAWSHYEGEYVTDAIIYDGVTTVELQQGQSYQILKYDEDSYRKFLLDNVTYNVTIPYSGGTGTFTYANDTVFRVNYNGGFYDITMTDVGNDKWSVSILKTVGVIDNIPDQTYTGSEIKPEPLVMAGSLNLTKGTDYEYSYESNINVGTAKVTVTFKGDYASLGSVEKEFKIVKATPTVTAPVAVENLVYNGNEQELVTAGITDKGTLLYSLDGNDYSDNIPKAKDAGKYTVYYKVDEQNYWYEPKTLEVTIAKATPTVTAPKANTLTYNGEEQELVTKGSTDFGTLLYSLDGQNYSADIPTRTAAGTYTVYYKVEGSDNWDAVDAATVESTIAPKTVTSENISVTIPSQNYTGNVLTPVITVTDGTKTLIEGTDYTVTAPSGTIQNVGNYTYTINGIRNYSGSTTATFTIAKATPNVTAPKANTLTYNGSEQELVTAGSTDFGKVLYSLDGKTYYEKIPKEINAGDYNVYYKVEGSDNWNAVEAASVNVTIKKATPSYDKPDDKEITCMQTLKDIELPKGYSFGNVNQELSVGVNEVKLTFTPEDTDNYEVINDITIKVISNHTFDKEIAEEKYLKSEATCTDKAVYYKSCKCGEKGTDTFEYGEALGHDYADVTYTWSDDGKTCTAKTICTRKECTDDTEGHTVTETVQSTGKETKAATCEEKGITTYTATFENELFETQTKEVADIDAKGHRYGITTYEWSEDGKSCTATSVCSNDSTHKITETAIYEQDKADSQIKATVKEAATTEKMGTTTYTATFKNAEMFKVQTKDVVDIPKVEVTDNPSDNPADKPSDTPSDKPTDNPTDKPGDNPSKPTDTTNPTDTTKPSDTTKTDGNTSSNDTTKDTSVTPAPKEEGAKLPATDTKAEYVVNSKAGEEPAVEYKPASDAADKTVTVPESVTVDGVTYAVNEIADNAFKGNKTVESVVIPKSVKEIGDSAFSGCTNLKSVTIPGSVTEIGDNAFTGCTNLKSVKIPESVTEIGDKAFSGCKKLKSVTIGKNVAEIGDSAFVNCIALKKATLPANVTKLGSNIFKGCKNLKTITVKSTKLKAKNIAKNALKGIGKKVTIKVPKKMKKAYTKLFRKKGLSKKVKIK